MFSDIAYKIISVNTTTDTIIIEYGFWRYIRKREKTIENCPHLKLLVSTGIPNTPSNIIKCLLKQQTSMTKEYFNNKYKVTKIKPCPNCGCPNRLVKVHILSKRLAWWWYITCDNCHWCGKTKLFLKRAIKEWNKK